VNEKPVLVNLRGMFDGEAEKLLYMNEVVMLKNKAFTERTTFLEENFLSTGSFFRKKVY